MTFVKKNITVAILLTLVIASFTISSSAYIWGDIEDVTILMQSVVGNYPQCASAILHTEGDFEHRSYSALGCDICPRSVVGWGEDWSKELSCTPDRSEAVKEFPWSCWSKHDMCDDWGITLN